MRRVLICIVTLAFFLTPLPSSFTLETAQEGGILTGHLSNNATTQSPVITGFQEGNSRVVTFSVGKEHYCFLPSEPTQLICRGDNSFGQLGDAGVNRNLGEAVIDIQKFGLTLSVSSGESHTCSLTVRSTVVCWGGDVFGQSSGSNLGSYSSGPRTIYLHGEPVKLISSGTLHTCALTLDGSVWCWGEIVLDYYESDDTSTAPIKIVDGLITPSIAISSGRGHSCSILYNRSVRCWGENVHGEIGADPKTNSTGPVFIPMPIDAVALALGNHHSCALVSNGDVYCWGSAAYGLFSSEGVEDRILPEKVLDEYVHLAISSGDRHVCTVSSNQTLRCFGDESHYASTIVHDVGLAISVGARTNCYAMAGENTVICILLDEMGNIETSHFSDVFLPSFDSDSDGVVDTFDRFPLDYRRSVFCAPRSFGSHVCAPSPQGHFVEKHGALSPTQCEPGSFQPDEGMNYCAESPPGHFVESHGKVTPTPCPAGSYLEAPGSVENLCETTPRGHYSPSGSPTFYPCEIGTFQQSEGQPKCTPAAKGHYSPSIGSTSQIECSLGHYQPDNMSSSCTPALSGHYVDINASEHATPCPGGTFSDSIGATTIDTCVITSPGHYSLTASPVTTPCPVGTFQPMGGQSFCLQSTPGHFVELIGAIYQIQCPVGSFQPNPSQIDCILAEIGHYVSAPGSSDQTLCPNGSYTEADGSSSDADCSISAPGNYTTQAGDFSPCSPGTYQPSPDSDSCVDAEPGYYVPEQGSKMQIPSGRGHYVTGAKSTVVTPCPNGSYSLSNSSTSVDACSVSAPGFYTFSPLTFHSCPVGSFQPNPSQIDCILAEIGHYVSAPGSSDQTLCPNGSYTEADGSSSDADCSISAPGNYTTQAGDFSPCSPGTYQPSPDSDSCVDAEPGYYVPEQGSSMQLPCSEGFFQPDHSQSGCLYSEIGHYVEQAGSEIQNPCPMGYFQPEVSQSECIESSPGFYSDSVGSINQLPCPEGYYQPMSGKYYCFEADEGFYAPQSGSSEQLPSTPGHFIPESGSSAEIPCEPGYFQPMFNQTYCLHSEPGFFVSEPASTDQANCSIGHFQSDIGKQSCKPADPGHYVAHDDPTTQKPCNLRTYQPNYGSSYCIDAAPGQFVSSIGRFSPEICPGGTYSEAPGRSISDCMIVEPGNYAPEGSDKQLPCMIGTYQSSPGAPSCLEAQPGYYVDSSQSSTQFPCQSGTYQNQTSSSECITTPSDYFSGTGASNPTPCPYGGYSYDSGANSRKGCITDSDSDGIPNLEDKYPNSAFMGNDTNLALWLITSNLVVLIAAVNLPSMKNTSHEDE